MTYVPENIRLTQEAVKASPERRLWLAVLACAVRDLQSKSKHADSVKRWMLTRGEDDDFRHVCDLAGCDADAFRAAVVRYVEDRNGQLTEPEPLNDVLLSGNRFNVRTLGRPAYEVVERIKELAEYGAVFYRMGEGVYQYIKRPGLSTPESQRDRKSVVTNHFAMRENVP